MKGFLQRFYEKRRLVDELFVPSAQRTSVLYCRLTDFKAKAQLKLTALMYIFTVWQFKVSYSFSFCFCIPDPPHEKEVPWESHLRCCLFFILLTSLFPCKQLKRFMKYSNGKQIFWVFAVPSNGQNLARICRPFEFLVA